MFVLEIKISYVYMSGAAAKNNLVLYLNITDSEDTVKSMLTAIPSQIIKIMSTYSRETYEYGGSATNCQQVARLPNLVKSAIQSADVPIKRFDLLLFSI